MKQGLLKFFSVGQAAHNKPLDTDILEVVPIEHSSFLDGEITADETVVSSKGTDSSGGAYDTQVKATQSIKAKWFPMGTMGNNRRSPDVRRGAIVAIWQFANSDKYYWMTLLDDSKLRKLETVVWGVSATKEEDVEVGPDNMYFFEVSTHTGLVHFHTSQANGEPFGYDIQINTAEGFFTVRDTAGNILNLNSQENRWEMINKDGSLIDMFGEKMKIFTKTSIDVETKTYNLKCETENVDATTRNVTAITNHKGAINQTGNLTVAGNISGKKGEGGGGQGTFEGSLETTETFSAQQGGEFSGTMKAKKVISTQPIEAPNV